MQGRVVEYPTFVTSSKLNSECMRVSWVSFQTKLLKFSCLMLIKSKFCYESKFNRVECWLCWFYLSIHFCTIYLLYKNSCIEVHKSWHYTNNMRDLEWTQTSEDFELDNKINCEFTRKVTWLSHCLYFLNCVK